jgi:hypothetical protein
MRPDLALTFKGNKLLVPHLSRAALAMTAVSMLKREFLADSSQAVDNRPFTEPRHITGSPSPDDH